MTTEEEILDIRKHAAENELTASTYRLRAAMIELALADEKTLPRHAVMSLPDVIAYLSSLIPYASSKR